MKLKLSFLFTFCVLSCAACEGLDGLGGMSSFDPVDEDYARQSPALSVAGPVIDACEERQEDVRLQLQPEEEVFSHALCLCGDLKNVGSGLTTRSTSALRGEAGGMGHVGVNGSLDLVGDFDVDGDLDVANGIDGVGSLNVGERLIIGTGVDLTGHWEVGGEAWIDGDLDVVGTMNIGGDLYLTGAYDVVGTVTYDQGRQGFTYRGQPCACDAQDLLDVSGTVAAKATDNDNTQLPTLAGEVSLSSGRYYFGGAQELLGATQINIEGHVELYVEGDIESVGALNIILGPAAELELWLSGTIASVGNISVNEDGQRPRAFRLFMGGDGASLVSVGDATFVGAIYAPEVAIDYVGDLSVFGSLFAKSIDGTGSLHIIHDSDLPVPQDCADEEYAL